MTQRELFLNTKRDLRRKNVKLVAETILMIPLGFVRLITLLVNPDKILLMGKYGEGD